MYLYIYQEALNPDIHFLTEGRVRYCSYFMQISLLCAVGWQHN